MPQNKPSTITVGAKCFSCILYASKQCPYGNHLPGRTQLTFKGDVRGKCSYYIPIDAMANSSKNIKTAASMKDTELNVELYKKIAMLNKKQKEKLFHYWKILYGPKYADEMVDDKNKSSGEESPASFVKQKKEIKKTIPHKTKNKFPEEFKS